MAGVVVGRDHPRSRGVYDAEELGGAGEVGSSPLARGLPRPGLGLSLCVGIIPARAGFTPSGPWSVALCRDHPRSRGVYRLLFRRSDVEAGSSPLARGLPAGSVWQFCDGRIIPARAGFTPPPPASARPVRDHPRSRGVYALGRWSLRSFCGSSPLARGLQETHMHTLDSLRIIPARAGFTVVFLVFSRFLWDHPRSRGVYTILWGDVSVRGGSSPLARGLRAYPHRDVLE